MSVTRQDRPGTIGSGQRDGGSGGESVGAAPKRNSGLFSFFRWFRPSSDPDLTSTQEPKPQEPPNKRPDLLNASSSSNSSSTDSLSSVVSTGTVASFAFVPPSAYKPYGIATPPEKCIVPGPPTDTYRARLAQRDKRRESDKDLTLRKKYNLFFGNASKNPTSKLSKSASASNCTAYYDSKKAEHAERAKSETVKEEAAEELDVSSAVDDNYKSLPLMTRRTMQNGSGDSDADEGTLRHHRRANSESSKVRKAGAFCHVKGKRRAPQPPVVGGVSKTSTLVVDSGTMSLRRKKRLAPQPPAVSLAAATSRVLNALEHAQANRYGTIEYADADVLYNDSLKLDNGILKSAKDEDGGQGLKASPVGSPKLPTQSARSSVVLDAAPVSPRPWYKRTLNSGSNRDSGSNWKASIPVKTPGILASSKSHDDYEPIDTSRPFPEVGFCRSPKNDLNYLNADSKSDVKKGVSAKEAEKRKSGLSFLTNISELDREAAEIVKQSKNNANQEDVFREDDENTDLPPFMRPKAEHMRVSNQNDSWISPKRRSARDLIAKFNAITNVTKVTVNSAFFSSASSSSSPASKEGAQVTKDPSQLKREFFASKKSTSVDDSARILEQKAKIVSKYFGPSAKAAALSKSESSSAVPQEKQKSEPLAAPATPKLDRKSWYCPKCYVENEYWRIICHVCSTIKPYFDDLSTPPIRNNSLEKTSKKIVAENTGASGSNAQCNKPTPAGGADATSTSSSATSSKLRSANEDELFERVLQRSKTQIGFPTKSNIFDGGDASKKKASETAQVQEKDKKEEREKLKKMLIEMKNSLPKRKLSNGRNSANRASVIQEDPVQAQPEAIAPETPEDEPEKVAEVTLVATETVYENIRMRRTENPKPAKVSSSCQTNAQPFTKIPNLGISGKPPETTAASSEPTPLTSGAKAEPKKKFELIRAKDFIAVSSSPSKVASVDNSGGGGGGGAVAAAPHIYANINEDVPAETGNGAAKTETAGHQSFFLNVAERLDDKDNTRVIGNNNNTDTLEINRLLRRLESAISKGELGEASVLARDLAQLKVSCSVVRQKSVEKNGGAAGSSQAASVFTADMYVEDRVSHRGPFPVQVHRKQTVQELKIQVEKEFQIPRGVQRWILGKQLASDDTATLQDHSVTSNGCPIFLYLVAPPSNTNINNNDFKLGQSAAEKLRPQEVQAIEERLDVTPTPQQVAVPIPAVRKSLELAKAQNATQETVAPATAPAAGAKEQAVIQTQPVVVQQNTAAPVPKVRQHLIEKKETLKQATTQPPIKLEEPAVIVRPEPAPRLSKLAPLATEENAAQEPPAPEAPEYDNKTLKPTQQQQQQQLLPLRNDWQCEICTLLNPLTSNICAVCATIRKISPQMQLQIQLQQKQLLQAQRGPPRAAQAAKTPIAAAAHAAQTDQRAEGGAKDHEAHYRQLVDLDNRDMVRNVEPFECIVCMTDCDVGEGVTLRECLHQFCRACLAHTVEYCEEAEIKCPYRDDEYACDIALQDREVKALVTKAVYEQHLAKSVAQAENKTERSFHCKTPDCRGWCIFEDNVNEFRCPVCRKINCLTCQAIHMGVNCKQYQERINEHYDTDIEAKKTREMLDEMVSKGEALKCPTCQVVLMKKWGCDWLRCSMCKTEICWVTRGPRWGLAGKGDISGGCQCGVNGIKCHPQCNYCH